MSYSNFIPNVYSKDIMKGLEKALVFGEGCWNVYDGKVSKQGDSIIFRSMGDPTIHSTTRDAQNGTTDIASATELETVSLKMDINQMAYFNHIIGDIDEAQTDLNGWSDLKSKCIDAFADEMDSYIAKLGKSSDVKLKSYKTGTTAWNFATDKVTDMIDDCLVKLYEKNVSKNAYVEVILTPSMCIKLKNEILSVDTNNSDIVANGKVMKYGNVQVKMSNNVAKDSSNNNLIMCRTKNAIGFANPLTHTEAYRPDLKFADCLKGFTLFDAKIIRPNELVVAICG